MQLHFVGEVIPILVMAYYCEEVTVRFCGLRLHYKLKGNLAHNFVPHCLLYFSSNLDIIKPSKVRNTENIGLRIDTSGGSVNCSAPFEEGWMCGSL